MLDRIKNLNPWILAFLLALGIELLATLVMDSLNLDYRDILQNLGFIISLPALKITGYETVQAINDFAGKPEDLSQFTEVALTSGIGTFIILILGPFLLLKGYLQADQSENLQKRSWTWYIGAILIMLAFIPSVLSATVGTKVHLNSINSAEDSRQKDLMRSQLMNLALDASSTLFLPHKHGGGDGSFLTYGSSNSPITLNDLSSYEKESAFDFRIHGEVTDSSLTIVGVSSRPGKDEEFQNVNGEIGRQQLAITVTPYKENIFEVNTRISLQN